MTTENNNSTFRISEQKGISAVWLIPIIALIFALWLGAKAITERGEFISIEFDSANGIIAGKTEVRYKGLAVGKVKKVDVSKDFQRVIVSVEMLPDAAPLLTENTVFWYVTADVSLDGVSGLDTLLSGGYISILPDLENQGSRQDYYVALGKPPAPKNNLPGLHITLFTTELGSLGSNSPVTYKQMPVGHVTGYQYLESDNVIEVNVFIEPEHANLVKKNSQFWNSSGINVTASFSGGLKVRTESMASLITGGIAFDSLDESIEEPVSNGHEFTLYRDYQAAAMGYEIDLVLAWNSGIDRSAAIIYQGITIGQIDRFKSIDPTQQQIIATAKIDPRMKPYLTEKTDFFVVTPKIDISGMNNLNAMLLGSYIGVRPSLEGAFSKIFTVKNQEPPLDFTAPGLHLILTADDISSLTKGSGVFSKQKRVGTIQEITFLPHEQYRIHVYIEPEYEHFVNHNTRFWNASGLRITGGLQNFEIQAQSIKAMLGGGIGFTTEKDQQSESVEDGSQFTLFKNKDEAEHQLLISLKTDQLSAIQVGITRVMYKGLRVGLVLSSKQAQGQGEITVGLQPKFDWLLKKDSQFWLVKPNISLSGLTDTEALIGGSYISFYGGDSAEFSDTFNLLTRAPAKNQEAAGLQLKLATKNAKGLKSGSRISYKNIDVGSVDSIQLTDAGRHVALSVTIDEEYRALVNDSTRFYIASGMSVNASLQGIKVQAESLDNILLSGISFINQDHDTSQLADENSSFVLYDDLETALTSGTEIVVSFNQVKGLSEGMLVKSGVETVGKVTSLLFNDRQNTLDATIVLTPKHSKYAVADTKFWLAGASNSLAQKLDVKALLSGSFIEVELGNGDKQHHFTALEFEPTTTELQRGKNITLIAKQLGSIAIGSPILYRQIKVGEVIGAELTLDANNVAIYGNIYAKYAKLVTSKSKFWNVSGVKIDAGLFSGITVQTESVESLVSGGIAFATPNQGQHDDELPWFDLHTQPDKEWLVWQPAIKWQ